MVNEQSLRDVTEKAEGISTARGVRRVVAIFVKKGEVHEWSREKGAWEKLDLEGRSRGLRLSATPLPLRDLLDAAAADDVVARALLAKDNPVLVAAKQESRDQGRRDGRDEGRREGRREGLLAGLEAACELCGIELTDERRARIGALDTPDLDVLLGQIRTQRRWPS